MRALLPLGVSQQEWHLGERSALRLPSYRHCLRQHLLQVDHLPDVKHQERAALLHPGTAGPCHSLCHSSPRPHRQVRVGRTLRSHLLCHCRPLPLRRLRCLTDVWPLAHTTLPYQVGCMQSIANLTCSQKRWITLDRLSSGTLEAVAVQRVLQPTSHFPRRKIPLCKVS